MLSENVRLHLSWIQQAAREGQLAVLEVRHKITGEPAAALVIVIDDPEAESYEMYPVATVTEDIGEFMNTYVPPEDVEEPANEGRHSGESLSLVDERPRGTDEEVHGRTVREPPYRGGEDDLPIG